MSRSGSSPRCCQVTSSIQACSTVVKRRSSLLSVMLSSFPALPVELGLRISHYLSAHDILCASSSSKSLYQAFAKEDIWRSAYRSLLKGYQDHQFVLTELVRTTKGPDYRYLSNSCLSNGWTNVYF